MEREQSNFAPSRRRMGALLAAAGAAVALPAATAIAATIEPDAELIAFAEHIVLLSGRADRAWLNASCREDAAQLAAPEHPVGMSPMPGLGPYRELPAATLRQYLAEAAAEPMFTDDDPWMVDTRARLASMEAHEAEVARLERHYRTEQAAAVASRAEDRLREKATQLVDVRATTLAGLVAKAKAALAGDALENNADWATALAASTLADLLTIGGAA